MVGISDERMIRANDSCSVSLRRFLNLLQTGNNANFHYSYDISLTKKNYEMRFNEEKSFYYFLHRIFSDQVEEVDVFSLLRK